MSKKNKLREIVNHNLYDVIVMTTLYNKNEKDSADQFAKSLNSAVRTLSKLKSSFPNSKIVLNLDEVYGEIIRPFETPQALDTEGSIYVKDLELICNFSKKIEVKLVKENTQQDLPLLPDEETDNERLANAKLKAIELSNLMKNENIKIDQLNTSLSTDRDERLIRTLIALSIEGVDLDLVTPHGNSTLPTVHQAPLMLSKNEFRLQSVLIFDISKRGVLTFLVDSKNSNILIDNNIFTNKIEVSFCGDNNEFKLLKFLQIAKIKFDVDIHSFEKISDQSLTFSLLKIHITQNLKDLLLENIQRLFNVLEENN